MIALNNQINAAREITKSHTSDVETFRSGDYGFLAANPEVLVMRLSELRRQIAKVRAVVRNPKELENCIR